ncbi:bifunctional metallophosphatase/5'-nucleotidase [Flavobacteriaceae bacterium TP-CH-4]|uniref:Bifunctional metallophosphatase/5'-nucleotidase n=1 Tax=Pelagihabitans pacificus TaxID=2696054 RepID=A0A967E668_9FLAO|nr:metallophosphatase [Pelagihabitans pacificus]NHF59310.1 bifunctional metallophosphatase/5'-nucleotidase [Pelagihabitans pacificus]
MKRRKFLKKVTASSALVGLGGLALNSCLHSAKKHVTILHTNDVHSHIDAFPKEHSTFPNLGGLARRATLVERIRTENPNTLLLDAGDIFQGTPYFNFYGGELEFKLMSMLKYDAATIGNHDFDNGVDGLYAQLPHAKFELLSANYDFSNTLMEGHVQPYQTYVRDGIKIGVYGLGIKLDGLVTKALYKETKYLPPYEIAQDCERKLKTEEQCDIIVCLSHLGYRYLAEHRPNDLELASKTKNTDLIIGGHTHTFLDKPTIAKNIVGNNVLVNQVGCYGVHLGRIDFYFDDAKNVATTGTSIIV